MGKKYNFIGDDMIEKFETHNDGIGDESKGSTYKGQIETSFAVIVTGKQIFLSYHHL